MKVKETLTDYRTQKKIYTYQDYLELPEDGKRYEIIEGELIMTPAPYTVHQRVSRKIVEEVTHFLKKTPLGEIFFAPMDVVLSEPNVVQPDILFVSNENSGIITEKNITGAPDLIVEILSPFSGYYDLIEKKELYEKFGVKEYWIVDPKKQWVEIYVNEDNKFRQKQRLEKTGILSSSVLEGFQIAFDAIFTEK